MTDGKSYGIIATSCLKKTGVKVWIFLMLLLTSHICGKSQTTTHPTIQKGHRLLTTQDGLPGIEVTCLLQDRKGYIWIGTKSGLARYDGNEIKTWGFKEGLINSVGDIKELKNGALLIMTYQGFQILTNEHLSQVYGTDTFDYVMNQCWAGTDGNYYFQCRPPSFDTNAWQQNLEYIACFDPVHCKTWYTDTVHASRRPANLGHGDVLSIFKNAGHATYQIIHNGRAGKTYSFFFSPLYSMLKDVPEKYLLDEEGNIYTIQLRTDSLQCTPTGRKANIDLHSSFQFALDEGNILYQTSDKRLVKQSPDGHEELVGTANSPWEAMQDREGNLWLATEDGLYQYFHLNFTDYQFNFSNNKNDNIWEIGQADDSSFYLGSQNVGLWRYDAVSGSCKLINLAPSSPHIDNSAWTYHPVCQDHVLYMSGCGQIAAINGSGVKLIRDHDYHMYLYPDQLTGNLIFAGSRVVSYTPGKQRQIIIAPKQLGAGNSYVRAVTRDKFGRLWFVSDQRIGYIDAEKKVRLFNTASLGFTTTVLQDAKGNLWFSGTSGLWWYNYQTLIHVTGPNLPSTITALHEYNNKYLLMSSPKGLAALSINAFYQNPGAAQSIFHYGFQQGYTGLSATQNGFWQDFEGYIWLPAGNEVVRFQPDDLVRATQPVFSPVLSQFETSNDKTRWISLQLPNADTQLNYPARQLRFTFKTITFSYMGQVQYQYRLKGYAAQWSAQSFNNEAVYTNLPPGKYQFEVRATIDGIHWTASTTSPYILLKPRWFERLIFRILSSIAALIVVISSAIYWQKTKDQKRRKLQDEKQQMQSLRLQALRNKSVPHFGGNAYANIKSLIGQGRTSDAGEYLALLSRLNGAMMQNAEQSSKSLRDELEFTEHYLKLEQLRFKDKLTYEVRVENEVDLSSQLPPMILHTWAENAVKHGLMSKRGYGKITIRAIAVNGGIEVSVTDDGIGRDEAMGLSYSTDIGLRNLDDQVHIYNQYNKQLICLMVRDNHDPDGKPAGTTFSAFVPENFYFL